MKRFLLILIAGSLAGCASSPPNPHSGPKPMVSKQVRIPDQKVPLSLIPLSGKSLDYGYRLYGDPYVLPSMVFSDEKFLYLALKKGQMPPLATTRDGKLLESEVKRGFVILPKVDSVVLRIGSRKGYVDRKGLKIVSLEPAPEASSVPLVLDVNITKPKIDKKDKEKKQNIVRLTISQVSSFSPASGPALYRACAFPSVSAYKALSKLKEKIIASGGKVFVSTKCWVPVKKNEVLLEKLK